MLTENPKVGQIVVATRDELADEGQYLTKDKQYEIAGISGLSGYPYHLDDVGDRCYIDEESWLLYKLEEEDHVRATITGIEIDAKNYDVKATTMSIQIGVATNNSANLLKVLDSLHDDIEKLLEEKYRF